MIIYFWRTKKLLPTSPVPLAQPPAREGHGERFEPSYYLVAYGLRWPTGTHVNTVPSA